MNSTVSNDNTGIICNLLQQTGFVCIILHAYKIICRPNKIIIQFLKIGKVFEQTFL